MEEIKDWFNEFGPQIDPLSQAAAHAIGRVLRNEATLQEANELLGMAMAHIAKQEAAAKAAQATAESSTVQEQRPAAQENNPTEPPTASQVSDLSETRHPSMRLIFEVAGPRLSDDPGAGFASGG